MMHTPQCRYTMHVGRVYSIQGHASLLLDYGMRTARVYNIQVQAFSFTQAHPVGYNIRIARVYCTQAYAIPPRRL